SALDRISELTIAISDRHNNGLTALGQAVHEALVSVAAGSDRRGDLATASNANEVRALQLVGWLGISTFMSSGLAADAKAARTSLGGFRAEQPTVGSFVSTVEERAVIAQMRDVDAPAYLAAFEELVPLVLEREEL